MRDEKKPEYAESETEREKNKNLKEEKMLFHKQKNADEEELSDIPDEEIL